jgi:hypothetical protein
MSSNVSRRRSDSGSQKDRKLNEHPLEAKIRSGLKKGRAIRAVFDLTLLASGVLVFAFFDTPMRPYLIATAVVMAGIIIVWPLVKGGRG